MHSKQLPGFTNATITQLDDDTVKAAIGPYAQKFRRSEYGSDQEFMMEVIWWARGHGGREVPRGV